MIKRLAASCFLPLFLFTTARGQGDSPDSLLPYLHGVRAKAALLLNVRGYEIIADKAAGNFSKPYFSKMFPGFNLHQHYKAVPDSSLGMLAFHVESRSGADAKEPFYSECYFVQKNADTVFG